MSATCGNKRYSIAHQHPHEANLLTKVLLWSEPYFSYQTMLQRKNGIMMDVKMAKMRLKFFEMLLDVKPEKKSLSGLSV